MSNTDLGSESFGVLEYQGFRVLGIAGASASSFGVLGFQGFWDFMVLWF